jgi:hypothetical protein
MNISLLRNSALVHTHKLCVAKEKRVSSIDEEVYLIIRRFWCEGLHKSRLPRRTHFGSCRRCPIFLIGTARNDL